VERQRVVEGGWEERGILGIVKERKGKKEESLEDVLCNMDNGGGNQRDNQR